MKRFDPGDLVVIARHTGPQPARYIRPLVGSRHQLIGFHQVTLLYPSGAEGKARRFHEADIKKAATCRECGCSDYFACTPPCHWVGRDLCSACA